MLGAQASSLFAILEDRLWGRIGLSQTRNGPADWWYCFHCVADAAGGHLGGGDARLGSPVFIRCVMSEFSAVTHFGPVKGAGSCGLGHPQITER